MISESDLCCKGSKCGECAMEVQDKDGQKWDCEMMDE